MASSWIYLRRRTERPGVLAIAQRHGGHILLWYNLFPRLCEHYDFWMSGVRRVGSACLACDHLVVYLAIFHCGVFAIGMPSLVLYVRVYAHQLMTPPPIQGWGQAGGRLRGWSLAQRPSILPCCAGQSVSPHGLGSYNLLACRVHGEALEAFALIVFRITSGFCHVRQLSGTSCQGRLVAGIHAIRSKVWRSSSLIQVATHHYCRRDRTLVH